MTHAESRITVIVPTYNRLPTLRLCLEHLEQQDAGPFDVIVVDDGSADGTWEALADIRARSSLRMRSFRQENAGPARARNLALAEIATPLAVLIGDDILASPGFASAHLRFHAGHTDRRAVGLGWTRWDERHQKLTPFMRWCEKVQFDYARLNKGLQPGWQHFYTSNLSFKTQLLRDYPFNESFRKAAFEDIELGFRLDRNGQLLLHYLPDAIATHVHPTTFLQAALRMETVGRSEHHFHQLWPQARRGSEQNLHARLCTFLSRRPSLLRALTDITEGFSSNIRPGKLHNLLLHSHRQLGYLDADRR